MGQETLCRVRVGNKSAEGKALLETDALMFRGGMRLTIPYKQMTALEVVDGELHVTYPVGTAVFELGKLSAKWADAIRNPKSVLDKLGIKPESRVVVLGISDRAFLDQLQARTTANPSTRLKKDVNFILMEATDNKDLQKLDTIQDSLQRDGAIWVIWRKGQPELKEDDVRARALDVGLVDVKVVKFSETHSGLKLVIPKSRR